MQDAGCRVQGAGCRVYSVDERRLLLADEAPHGKVVCRKYVLGCKVSVGYTYRGLRCP